MTSSVALLLFVLGAASALPRPQGRPGVRDASLAYRHYQADPSGQFSSSVHQNDGQFHDETGTLKLNREGTGYVLVLTGQYGYTSPEGKRITIDYTADENGFHPVGDAIPVQIAPVGASF